MVFLILLWVVDVLSTSCPSAFMQENFVLRNNVLASSVVKNVKECQDKCASHMGCLSVNYYHKKALCELNKANHLSNPVDLVPNIGGEYIVNNKRYKPCSDKYCSTGQRCLMKADATTYTCQVCSSALGMQSKQIPNSAITASSTYGLGREAWRGRLHNKPAMPLQLNVDSGCWLSKVRQIKEYLQINLGHVIYVTMVATQGIPLDNYEQYVTKYSLAYRDSDNTIVDYQVENKVKIFVGNTDATTVVTNVLPEKIRTELVRFVVMEWNDHISMRVEIYGCENP